MPKAAQNLFCRATDLSNEASVEQFFVNRLLNALGYRDREIKPKTAIDAIKVGKGRKKEPWKPDYALVCKKRPRWIVDAKSPTENPDSFIDQGGWSFEPESKLLQLNFLYGNLNLLDA